MVKILPMFWHEYDEIYHDKVGVVKRFVYDDMSIVVFRFENGEEHEKLIADYKLRGHKWDRGYYCPPGQKDIFAKEYEEQEKKEIEALEKAVKRELKKKNVQGQKH